MTPTRGPTELGNDRPLQPVGTAPDSPPGPITRVPRPKEAAREWYNMLSRWYNSVADPFERPARATGIEMLDLTPGERVLDIGCGTGPGLVTLTRAVSADGTAVGIDLADGMCRKSQRALADAGLDRGVVVLGDGAMLPFTDGSFDAVFASFVLELFDTPEIPTVLEEWRRVLKPDGQLCVVALSRRGGGPLTAVYEAIHNRAPTHVDCRPIYARETIAEAGFRILKTRDEHAWGLPVDVVLGRVPSY